MSDEAAKTHPVMLYRPGETVNPECWGEKIDHTIVEDDAVEAALKDGWFLHPKDFPPAPKAKKGDKTEA